MADVSIRDVAAHAGVSVSTVSNALNRPETVSRRAIGRVLTAIDELGYVPNVAARQLRAGRSNSFGLAVINITNPFFSEVTLGAEEAAEKDGYSILVGNSYDSLDRQNRHLELFELQRVDGVLIAPLEDQPESIERFRNRGVPVVLVDRRDRTGNFSSVWLDDAEGGRLAVNHLVQGGARHVAFMGGPLTVRQMSDRLDGARAAAEAAGVRLTEFGTDTLNPGLGRELGERIVRMPESERPDAIFAANDVLALGVLQSLIGGGLRIPDDIAIIGYDDIEFAAAAIVPLSSVHQPAYDMGAKAAELLMRQLAEPDERFSAQFEPVLTIRASTRS